MSEADGLVPWITLIHKLCPLHPQSSSEQGTTQVPKDGDGIPRWLALVQKLYCPPRQPRATATLNLAATWAAREPETMYPSRPCRKLAATESIRFFKTWNSASLV